LSKKGSEEFIELLLDNAGDGHEVNSKKLGWWLQVGAAQGGAV
jgi:hypothetical protein